MSPKRVLLIALVCFMVSAPAIAEDLLSNTFILATGGVRAAQTRQAAEDAVGIFQIQGIKMLPYVPWYVGGMIQYENSFMPGEDLVDWNGRIIAFSRDPNNPEVKGTWIAFVTVGSIDLHDNDEDAHSQLVHGSADGSIGAIGPVFGTNIVVEVGAKRMANSLGKIETYWSFNVGFFGVPKL